METKPGEANDTSVNSAEASADASNSQTNINAEEADVLTKLPKEGETQEQWQQILSQAYAFISKLPDPVVKFFNDYKQLIIIIAAGFGAFISVKVLLAMLGALNEVPLVAPTFEVIGIFYAGWLIFRYAPTAEKRQEFQNDFNSLKDRVLGNKDSADVE